MFYDKVSGLEKLTMLDYPSKMAAILFYSYCNFHCPYCYNTGVVNGTIDSINPSFVENFLEKRRGVLDAVVFSGGECTIWGDRLLEDMRHTKEKGYLIKVDTNGSNPELVSKMLNEGLVDFVAIDFKCLSEKSKLFYNDSSCYDRFLETLGMMIDQSDVEYEVRTTVHEDVINIDELSNMCKILVDMGYNKPYGIQQFFVGNGKLSYMDSNLNRTPNKVDLSKVDTHGLIIDERNS